jgi:hypothetical protein
LLIDGHVLERAVAIAGTGGGILAHAEDSASIAINAAALFARLADDNSRGKSSLTIPRRFLYKEAVSGGVNIGLAGIN